MAEQQSPVDIPAGAPTHHDGLRLEYRPVPLAFAANDYAVQIDCPAGGHASIEGRRYELLQFHIHCPAEHAFEGRREPAELHFVHTSPTHGLAVIGLLFVVGASHPGLEPLVSALGGTSVAGEGGSGPGGPATIDPAALMPRDRRHVRYDGSLTVPPYTEGVAWYVFTAPATLSPGQLRALEAVRHSNARPIQPLGKRTFR